METAKSVSLHIEALACTFSSFCSASLPQECHRPFEMTYFNCGSVEGELGDNAGNEKRWKLEQHVPLISLKDIKAQTTFHTIVLVVVMNVHLKSPRFAFVDHLGTGELLRTRTAPTLGLGWRRAHDLQTACHTCVLTGSRACWPCCPEGRWFSRTSPELARAAECS